MKFKYKKILWLFLASVFIVSCSKEDVYEVIEEPKTLMEQSFGNDVAQKMDVYLPAGRSQATTQVILIIHGGGWMLGDKKDMNSFVPKFQSKMKENYAVVNMNYRLANLSPRYMLPTQTDDIHSAMDYIAENASTLGVKPEFVVVGLSAGGHLAMLYSYKHDTKRRVKAVVNIVGPSNLDDDYYKSYPIFRLGMNYITDPKNLPKGMTQSVFGSPVTWITKNAPPTISFYGSTDQYIPAIQHTALEQKLNEHKIPNAKHIYNGGHGVGFEHSDDIVARTAAFLEEYVR